MWASLQSNKTVGLVLCAAVTSVSCFAQDVTTDPLLEYRTKGNRHGLYEIREAAKEFIRRENIAKKSHWVVGNPDIRVVVWECAVPLVAKWNEADERRGPRVAVSCPRTLENAPVKTWRVRVPVYPY
jgi:hypothetical protein